MFRYIAQHRSVSGEFQFIFNKAKRSGPFPEVEIKTKQAGGYSILQLEKMDTRGNEDKVFAFVIDPGVDLNIYRQLPVNCKLNIYEAYYESCRYPYILE